MAALTCDICGGQLSMDPSGDFAVCENCGMKHTKDRIKTKAQEITGTIKIDDSDAIKEQISNWEKMAGDAFNNKNYSEAYTYYCKILERDTGYWLATYRKGLCIGWQGNLKDMHINEVLGGIVDASKLLYEDEMQTASLKANGVLLMATEVYNWINSINTLAANHWGEYGMQLVSVTREFYHEEQIICSLIKFNINMITEFVYENYEDKKGIEVLVNAICNLGKIVVENMETSITVKTGKKWNSFWLMYEDVHENVTPDYKTQTFRNDLRSTVSQFQSNFHSWKANYERKVAEQQKKEKEERRFQYWAEHTSEKEQYDARLIEIDSELDSLRTEVEQFDLKITEIKKIFSQSVSGESRLIEIQTQQTDLIIQKSHLGLFAYKQKKQLQSQIDALQPEINDLEVKVDLQKNAIRDDVHTKINVIEAEKKPITDRINALESEKKQINTELTKER